MWRFIPHFYNAGHDQFIFDDVALQNLDVTFAVDRAGLVGSDGPTHPGGVLILSFLRCIPNVILMRPLMKMNVQKMLSTAYEFPGPAMVRYPRGKGPGVEIENTLTLPIGKAEILRKKQSRNFSVWCVSDSRLKSRKK